MFFLWGFINSNWLTIKIGEREFSKILKIGTPKESIVNFVSEKSYYFSEHSKNDKGYYLNNGLCRTMEDGSAKFRWNCEYPGYVFTRRNAGFLSLTNPSLRIYFVYDKEDKLVKYYIGVGHTFI